MNALMNFINDVEGVTAIEYGLIASLIAVAIIVAVTATGLKLSDTFIYITSLLKSS